MYEVEILPAARDDMIDAVRYVAGELVCGMPLNPWLGISLPQRGPWRICRGRIAHIRL